MPNPLFDQRTAPAPNGAMNGFADMMNRFNQFRQSFSGDPRQAVQSLLNSGRMTQAQYEQLSQAATQLQNMLGINR